MLQHLSTLFSKTNVAFGLLFVFGCSLNYANAESIATLTMSPEQCIALNQGQTCYQTVVANWQVDKMGDYCLFEQKQSTPLACWKNRKSGQAKIIFESTETVTFDLRLKPIKNISHETLVEADITVNWVYSNKKRKRSTWRLF